MASLRVLNRNQIKYIVITAMLIDHIAWGFVPTLSNLGMAMHFIGRLTGPTMAFFLAEGYLHTHNVKRYALRLGIFAAISWLPFTLFEIGRWPAMYFSVIYTLFLGLLAVWVWDKARIHKFVKITVVIVIFILSSFGDWAYMDVALPLILIKYRDDERLKWRGYIIMCLLWVANAFTSGWKYGIMQSGIIMVPIMLILLYNGESGSRHPFHKWFFYVFYPLHLMVLAYIKYHATGFYIGF